MIGRKAQGTTEYLIILAVIIVIALVVVGVMGWVPGLSGGITEQQSRAYWQSTSPFSIVEFKFDAGATTAQLEIQNISANKLTLTNVTLDGINDDITDIAFNAGERKLVSLTATQTCGTAGTGFDYNVSFTYNSKNVVGLVQIGDKSLIGKCV